MKTEDRYNTETQVEHFPVIHSVSTFTGLFFCCLHTMTINLYSKCISLATYTLTETNQKVQIISI